MRAIFLWLLVLVTVLAQVAIAPFFPVLGTIVHFPVVMLLLLAIFAGPHAVMFAFPVLVLFLGFSTNVEFEWLALAYLPLLPCAAWIQGEHRIPQTPYALVLVMTVAAAVWIRGIFVLVAVGSGADATVGEVFVEILLPGVMLDGVILSLAYGLCRWIGWPTRSLELERVGF